jgi:hypothetical protein
LNFSGILFSSAISFQVGVLGKLAGILLDCAFDFVKQVGCVCHLLDLKADRYFGEAQVRRPGCDSSGR